MHKEFSLDDTLIMVVDDDPLIQESLRLQLEKAGYSVNVYGDGISALGGVKTNRPDLIILDIKMPGLDGYEVCERLKNSEDNRDIPVLMLTAYGSLDHIIKGLEMGADDYVSKPFEFEELMVRIKSLLRMRSIERELRDRETNLARVQTMGQLLVTMAHHINNSLAVISGRAQATKSDNVEMVEKMKKACLKESRKIQAVLKSLEEMARQMKINTTNYAGVTEAMIDIEKDIQQKLEGMKLESN